MNNVFVYCEINEEGHIAEVSLELLSKGRRLANKLNVELEALAIGYRLENIADEVFTYGVNILHLADDKRLFPYLTLPHASIVTGIFKEEQPQIALFGATSIGRDLAPRVASALRCGLTADCTSLEIGNHTELKSNKVYQNLLYQIRPAFGGNIVATIVNPDTRPQMATVRDGVMKKEPLPSPFSGKINHVEVQKYLSDVDFVVQIIDRHIEQRKVNLKGAQIIVSGGYGVGTPENFKLLYELAETIGAEVGASRAAVDAGLADHERQIGQTGVTVQPKLYIACGISGAIQHRAGMDKSAQIISINKDPNAPINQIADYTIIGDVAEIIPKFIHFYKLNSK